MKHPNRIHRNFSQSLLILVLFSVSAAAATITVTNTNDSGVGSLRQAITDAAPGDTIVFNITGTIALTSGELVIDKSLKIRGPGAGLLSVSGDRVHVSSVFYVNYGVTTTFDGITIKDSPWKNGGGISNQGALTVSNCNISGNGSETYGGYGDGGGIYNASSATLNLIGSTVSGNISSDYDGNSTGGGIYNRGAITIKNSTISDNVSNTGGGICNYGTMTVMNSTISGNTTRWSGDGGGGIFDSDPFNSTVALTIVNSTISHNTGGGITSYCNFGNCPDNESLVNTIVAGNTRDGYPTDVYGTIETASDNLIGDAGSSGGIQHGVNGNIVGKNPMLGPLQNNGGPTMTHALLAGSPAINAGDNALAIGPTDQRGAGFARIVGGTVDIGSFELQIRPFLPW